MQNAGGARRLQGSVYSIIIYSSEIPTDIAVYGLLFDDRCFVLAVLPWQFVVHCK